MDQPHPYPLLSHLREPYDEAKLGNVLLLACQHLLEPQLEMIKTLILMGLKPENCIIAGKAYSTCYEVMQELKGLGCIVMEASTRFERVVEYDMTLESCLHTFFMLELYDRRQSLESYDKIVVLDDGGFLHVLIDQFYGALPNLVGIEQTSSGHHRIKKAGIHFPTISVARSHHKLMFESPRIGNDGAKKIAALLKDTGHEYAKALVLGMGPIGKSVAGHLHFVEKLEPCMVTDISVELTQELDMPTNLLRQHNLVLQYEEAMRRLGEFDVIIGATGTRVLSEEDIPRLHPEATLVSVSSSDREFPAVRFRKEHGGDVHDDYFLGKRVLANAGFPITFDGTRHGIPPAEIELTISLLMVRLLDEVAGHPHPLAYVVGQVYHMWLDQIPA